MNADHFAGYLIKFPATGQEFPHKYIAKDSYQSTPLQRTDLKAYRDNDILLHRIVSPNYKTKIEFSTIDKLKLKQLEQIQAILSAARINTKERKLSVEYWDDELMEYRTMLAAYQTDTTYPVSTISRFGNIKYRPIKFTFIEY